MGLFVCTPRVVADCACGINVPQGTVLTISGDRTTNCIKVAGTLNIVDGTLTLNGEGCATSKIDGTVNLLYTPPVIFGSLAFTSNDHLLMGNGAIDGQDDRCTIELGSDVQLESRITIEGNLQITEPVFGAANTTFVNGSGGLVRANNAGTQDSTDLRGRAADPRKWPADR